MRESCTVIHLFTLQIYGFNFTNIFPIFYRTESSLFKENYTSRFNEYFSGNGQDKGVEVNFQDGDTEYKTVTGLSPVVAERDCVAFEVKILFCKDISSYAMKCIASNDLLGKHLIASYCEVNQLLSPI